MPHAVYIDPQHRHDFVLLFDVMDGNPNGDPDAGNLPRVDPETMHGLVTDVAVKRKVRDFIDMTRGTEAAYKIYVQSGVALNTQHQRAYDNLSIKSTGVKQKTTDVDDTRAWMCHNFFDIRMFGAVMTTSVNCGQVRGPMQFTFARSVDPITPLDISITRIAVTREEDRTVALDEDGQGKTGKQSEMGRKAIVPYGLYRMHGFFNPHFARTTGVTSEDLEMVWMALQRMWEYDRSASRGMMTCRGLYIFTHENTLGNAPAHALFDRLHIQRHPDSPVVRRFGDYVVDLDDKNVPEGITVNVL